MRIIKGNLITLAEEGHFDMIGHGCNCFCTMGAGIAPQIANAFPDARKADLKTHKGDIRKLGDYSQGNWTDPDGTFNLIIFNLYSQFGHDPSTKPLDYEALTLALRKINHRWGNMNKRIGLPMIGAGLAGGDWNIISKIIEEELHAMDVIIVEYEKA